MKFNIGKKYFFPILIINKARDEHEKLSEIS